QIGICGRIKSESAIGLNRNQWSVWVGICNYDTAGASGLKVEAGGRAEVYAGILTGATVSGANASLTLMTPQTETADGDRTLSLTGQVSVTEGGRLVSQRGADMSGA
ncbi:hypothetical protein F9222_26890, partial [Escherichia coli]